MYPTSFNTQLSQLSPVNAFFKSNLQPMENLSTLKHLT